MLILELIIYNQHSKDKYYMKMAMVLFYFIKKYHIFCIYISDNVENRDDETIMSAFDDIKVTRKR
jgi:hypothetical protein